MSALTEPHTNGHNRELNGVRTYRGRKLEDLIPQIRAELGPDAIILRQREGLMGGVGGFFAQKCVEVDAQAARHTSQIDIYDEDEPVNGWDEGLVDFVPPGPAPRRASPPGPGSSRPRRPAARSRPPSSPSRPPSSPSRSPPIRPRS